ncbi:Zn-dependent hydrolase [Arthrobacter sp. PAMC 25486]|uniref:MBL fold metallo-hydrolase n=1 Tax=Arthrobacter sp. PAMC 25486 TaxID=1494608 RepID=UPI000535C4C1|nr:MBL fold metallo-hydrolase [Arthrobacter sp. PAMC 25486]AIY03570.1 Zn-dependent hydrolase [Arthrobacter sp. PAMC 25486]
MTRESEIDTTWESIGALARRRRSENPGPMTLDGTNSYVLAAPDAAGVVVVDPGPLLEGHLAELAGAGAVELILITHHHGDHTDGSARLHELTGAPVRAALPEFCHGGTALFDGELIQAGGLTIEVLATPGHTSDSLCFVLNNDGGHGLVLTGDTVLGRGTTMLDHPDGKLGDYLASLERLRQLGSLTGSMVVLPGHGPVLPDLSAAVLGYQAHRRERLAQVRAAVDELRKKNGFEPIAADVVAVVYADVPANVLGAAELSVQAQLEYLRG